MNITKIITAIIFLSGLSLAEGNFSTIVIGKPLPQTFSDSLMRDRARLVKAKNYILNTNKGDILCSSRVYTNDNKKYQFGWFTEQGIVKNIFYTVKSQQIPIEKISWWELPLGSSISIDFDNGDFKTGSSKKPTTTP